MANVNKKNLTDQARRIQNSKKEESYRPGKKDTEHPGK